ncbi:E3 ubiquitin-protein ligase Rnf220-like [Ostrinia nubilalis]|uniref:E3 ubiquitin-protein ligase Rnf220-like n=1 Tax=Ostrinia nubilalis TaxID=29057 RepID=UPI003082326D
MASAEVSTTIVRSLRDTEEPPTEPKDGSKHNGMVMASAEVSITIVRSLRDTEEPPTEPKDGSKHNGMVMASAETRIQALKAKIKELEKKQNGASESKCLICLGAYVSPAVSIQCWHVYCEVCWLQSLKAKKICPQCNAITTSQHLRRIYM